MMTRRQNIQVSNPFSIEGMNDARAKSGSKRTERHLMTEMWSAVRQAFGYAPEPQQRWFIHGLRADMGRLTVDENGDRHVWKLPEVAGAMFSPRGRDPDVVDVMLLLRGKRPQGLQQEYAGSLRADSPTYASVRRTLRELGIS
jgi:hypothetical protein